jgi:hypothetical protein
MELSAFGMNILCFEFSEILFSFVALNSLKKKKKNPSLD